MRLKYAYMIGGRAYPPGTVLFPVPLDLVEKEAAGAHYDHWEPGMRARLIEDARNCVRGHHFLARVWDQPHVYVIDTIAIEDSPIIRQTAEGAAAVWRAPKIPPLTIRDLLGYYLSLPRRRNDEP